MFRNAIFALLFATISVVASEVTIDAAKAEQLRRLEPLTAEKIDVFVDAGQLTAAQAAFVKKNIRDGKLAIPDSAIGAEAPRRVEPVPAEPPPPARPVARAESDVYAEFR